MTISTENLFTQIHDQIAKFQASIISEATATYSYAVDLEKLEKKNLEKFAMMLAELKLLLIALLEMGGSSKAGLKGMLTELTSLETTIQNALRDGAEPEFHDIMAQLLTILKSMILPLQGNANSNPADAADSKGLTMNIDVN